MKETIEHNNRFYGEELKTESEQLKEWLLIANSENERLHSIIKEVREYIEEKEKNDDNWIDYELCIEPIVIKEMLDKEKE